MKTITFGGGIQPIRQDKQTNFENMQTTTVNQGASIKNLETQIGQLTKLITNFSKDYAGNTVDNHKKEECKAVGERTERAEEKRKKDEKELRQLQKWFKQLRLTMEEAYDEFVEELDEYYEETLAEKLNIESKLPIKRKDPGTFTIPSTKCH
ncbi:hypothetical protein L195_g030040 [Trifolium pratense]|uniref:Uncharacterized protein n=1 Tax=Trifolium pratense TaxID=57577 RepID=A0A2K3L6G4_TRIPR|nr:hypothetical protein L195_g030040 [Trifolium pratense]